jgi:hypothetical protein
MYTERELFAAEIPASLKPVAHNFLCPELPSILEDTAASLAKCSNFSAFGVLCALPSVLNSQRLKKTRVHARCAK